MAAILKHNLAYISTFELPRKLKMVAIPMFVILRIATKSHKTLLVIVLLAAILDFKMLGIFYIFYLDVFSISLSN